MRRKKFQFSAGFINKVIDLTGGKLSSEQFELVISLLEKESSKFSFTSSSESNLLRIFTAVHDKLFFFQEIIKYPHHSGILTAISASSDYLTDIAVRHPEYLYQIFDQNYLSRIFDYEFYKNEINESVDRFNSFKAKLNLLRQIKQRFILKIGLADVLKIFTLETVIDQLSYLAISINQKLFEICYNEVINKYDLQKTQHKYCLCSLGKLGGNELNYSSDIDLLLFYNSNDEVKYEAKEFSEILSEAAQLYIKSSTEFSDHGFIYRVDFRLRPDGKYSPLCGSIDDYTRYYETRGEEWERQMLIKLNFVGGDERLFNRFNNFVQSYIYSFSPTSSVKDKIKLMKLNIERHIAEQDNVKTFTGGIRDIEFSVQALQLLNGSKFKMVRTPNTMDAIKTLTSQGLLKKNEQRIFTEAYIFYRKIEHFLQLMNNRQTHIIPDNRELLGKMINYLGFSKEEIFKTKLKFYRESVRKIYDDILKSNETKSIDNFKSIKFHESKKAESNLKYLRTGAGLIGRKDFDSRTIDLFAEIEPHLFKYLKKSALPQLTVENFTKIIRASKNSQIWYRAFTNENYFKNFLDVCTYSQKAVDLISSDYSLEELYLSGNVFQKDHSPKIYNIKQNTLLIAVQFTLGKINFEKTSNILSVSLTDIIEKTFNEFTKKYRTIIIGAGSFGFQSMDFGSDIDLIAFSEKLITSDKILNEFLECISNLKELVHPFQLDFKLRPEGKSSQLIWDLEHFKKYLQKRARVWEFQSLLKCSRGIGDDDLLDRFKKILIDCHANYDKSKLKAEVINMYRTILRESVSRADSSFNIKKDKGGLLTIDFILQYLILTTAHPYTHDFNFPSLKKLLKKKIEDKDAKALFDNYSFLKQIAIANQLIFNTTNSIVPSSLEKKVLITKFLKFKTQKDFDKKISEIITTNNFLFEKYVGK